MTWASAIKKEKKRKRNLQKKKHLPLRNKLPAWQRYSVTLRWWASYTHPVVAYCYFVITPFINLKMFLVQQKKAKIEGITRLVPG